MKACLVCSGKVQLIGECSFCLDCDWDDLPELGNKEFAVVFRDGDVIRIPGHEGPLPDNAVEIGNVEGGTGVTNLLTAMPSVLMSPVVLDSLFPSISGEYLDRLGEFIECYREDGESDDAYRRRMLSVRMGRRNA